MSLIIILFIVMLVIFSILWGNRTFSVKTLNQMFYHMIVPCDGTDDGIFKDWFVNCFPQTFITTLIGVFLLYKTPLVFLFDYQGICITILILGTLLYALINYQIITYVFDMVRTSKLYEEHYVDPKNVELEFKEKRNLIHIYLESVENTYLSKEQGGQEENNYIKELEKKDRRVKALAETKQGPNYARKTGFEASTGEYILFCDSDDFMVEDAVESFVSKIKETNADIVVANYKEVTRNNEFLKEKKGIPYKYNGENLKEHKDIIHIKPALWNKIFRRSLIKEDFFITSKIGEDMVITISSMMNAKNVVYIDKTVYHYVPNDEGLSNSVNVRNLLDILITTEKLKKIAEEQNTYSIYAEEIEFLCFTHVIYKILRTVMMENDKERIEVYTKLREYLKKNCKYRETKYYKTKLYYRIATVFLMNKSIYNLKVFRKMLKAIFKNKALYKCFKKLDN